MNKIETIELIEKTIDKVRPFINRDGGDITFDKFEDGFVYVTMSGACEGCANIDFTISNGIEVILMEEVPGILGVRLSEKKEPTL